MLSDPLAVTYDGSAKSLVRVSAGKRGTIYKTADSEFWINIRDTHSSDGRTFTTVELTRKLPDPTPADVFNDYRDVRNSFGITYGYDTASRAEASDNIPKLRTALLALLDATLQSRVLQGEK